MRWLNVQEELGNELEQLNVNTGDFEYVTVTLNIVEYIYLNTEVYTVNIV